MGRRKIIIKESVAISIAQVALYIESKGMVATAEKFSDSVYDFIDTLADARLTHSSCKDPERKSLGLKCKPFKKKYTIAFLETTNKIIITEFLISKLIKW